MWLVVILVLFQDVELKGFEPLAFLVLNLDFDGLKMGSSR
jgi:hypothetical protein